ncbi:MFS transporter [Streptomyces sp. NPDC050085]|uniref:MFS transporter n=1 Tax=Streptomyces sp. NPDC050085 TaxID=3365600 RepID=UPI00379A31BF
MPSLTTAAPAVGRHAAQPPGGLVRRTYLPRLADALAFATATYAIPLLVLATTRSAALTGAAFCLEWLPRLGAFTLAGRLVDQRGAAAVAFAASLGRALVAACAAGILWAIPAASTCTVMALAALSGVLTECSYIATETAGAVAARRHGERAHRVQAVLLGIDQGATLVGPALGGALLLIAPAWMLTALTALSASAALLALTTPPMPTTGRGPRSRKASGLRAGWRTIRALPALAALIGGLIVSNLSIGLLQAAGPIIIEHHYGASSAGVGLVWSVAAGATLISVAVCRPLIDRFGLWPVGATCAALAAASCWAVGQAHSYTAFAAATAALMAGEGGMTIVLRTLRARLIPEAVFGSTLATSILLLLLPFPLAGLITALTPATQLPAVISFCAVLQALALAGAFWRLRREPALVRGRTAAAPG